MGLPIPGDRFEREYGCGAHEFVGWLPAAVHGHAWQLEGSDAASVRIGEGELRLEWQPLSPRRIALVTLPRLAVRFAFERLSAAERDAFMRSFDLRTQRGGG